MKKLFHTKKNVSTFLTYAIPPALYEMSHNIDTKDKFVESNVSFDIMR